MKDILIFHLKTNIFTAVKYCCISHGCVFVMKHKPMQNTVTFYGCDNIKFKMKTVMFHLNFCLKNRPCVLVHAYMSTQNQCFGKTIEKIIFKFSPTNLLYIHPVNAFT